MQFSHLHNHSQFSLLDGASNISNMYEKAKREGMPAVAITDHGNMYGVFQFVAEAWKDKVVVGKDADGKDIFAPRVKPIVGCEFYLVEDRHKKKFPGKEKDIRYHQLFLAKNEMGYRNLTKLCSLGFSEGLYNKFPRIDKELVLKYHEGLIATTCCLGAEIPRTILREGEEAAEEKFKWWLDLFGEDYYIELQRHGISDQDKVNDVLLRFSKKYNVPIIASNDSHYVDQEDWNAHDILLCVNTGSYKSTPIGKHDSEEEEGRQTRFGFENHEFYFKGVAEMQKVFHDLPQAIENTQMIVDKITPLKLEREILLPYFKVPDAFNDDQDAYLEHLTWQGAKERYSIITPEVEERLNFELGIIKKMGFSGYFLIVSDFIKAGRDLGVYIGPGRGSAAGSAVAYCIGITSIDPIKYQLLFERFLNPERKSMPDIDTDFDDAGRQKVIDYVVNKYGFNQVAHIVTYGTMAAKSSIKDVARVLEIPIAESDMLSKLVPEKPGISLKRLLQAPIEGEKGLKDKEGLDGDDLKNVEKLRELYHDARLGEVLKNAERLEGSVRNTGIHASAIIIAPKELSDILPVAASKDANLLITQYDGSIIESAGVIKMDFLGLRTLTIIKDTVHLIKRNYGIDLKIEDIPLDDKATYELFQRGETHSIFQFESAGMQKHLKELKPDKFEDLIAMAALYRPGPMAYIPTFVKRKHGLEPIVYDLPEMEEFLGDTYGITVYQEQVMLLSQKLAGFSKGDADVLRKAMGKKQRAVLDKMKDQFVEGAIAKGHPKDKLNKIWSDWEAFAQYAFNKSHSTCYAEVAYKTAYLKTHYSAEFMAAVLNNAGSVEKIGGIVEECNRMGIKVLGPDINESIQGFSVNKEGVIRYGLNAINGVGELAADHIVEVRDADGEFKDLTDFIGRINTRTVNKKSIENIAAAGGFDSFQIYHRAQYLYKDPVEQTSGVDKLLRFANKMQQTKSQMGASLFGEVTMDDVEFPKLPDCDKWTLMEMLEYEKALMGRFISAHPLDNYLFEMTHFGFTDIVNVVPTSEKPVRMAGFVSSCRHQITKKGAPFGRLTLNDYTGSIELVFFNTEYANYKKFIEPNQMLVVSGSYKKHRFIEGKVDFVVSQIMYLDEVRDKLTKELQIYIDIEDVNETFLELMKQQVLEHVGQTKITITIVDREDERQVRLYSSKFKIKLTDEFMERLKSIKSVQIDVTTE